MNVIINDAIALWLITISVGLLKAIVNIWYNFDLTSYAAVSRLKLKICEAVHTKNYA